MRASVGITEVDLPMPPKTKTSSRQYDLSETAVLILKEAPLIKVNVNAKGGSLDVRALSSYRVPVVGSIERYSLLKRLYRETSPFMFWCRESGQKLLRRRGRRQEAYLERTAVR